MKLFHQLDEQDQQNSVHYCLHLVIDDLLDDGVQLETYTEEKEKAKKALDIVVEEAKKLSKDEQFNHIMDSEASSLVFDIALDMARSAFYHSNEDMVIYYEELRPEEPNSLIDDVEELEDINTVSKKGKHSLN